MKKLKYKLFMIYKLIVIILVLIVIIFIVVVIYVKLDMEYFYIVLILCDDMGFFDLFCYGGEIYIFNIDYLVE